MQYVAYKFYHLKFHRLCIYIYTTCDSSVCEPDILIQLFQNCAHFLFSHNMVNDGYNKIQVNFGEVKILQDIYCFTGISEK